jgi:hypothetical protein
VAPFRGHDRAPARPLLDGGRRVDRALAKELTARAQAVIGRTVKLAYVAKGTPATSPRTERQPAASFWRVAKHTDTKAGVCGAAAPVGPGVVARLDKPSSHRSPRTTSGCRRRLPRSAD